MRGAVGSAYCRRVYNRIQQERLLEWGNLQPIGQTGLKALQFGLVAMG